MKALIVYSHPNPKSFNKAIVDTLADEFNTRKIEYKLKDLYQMGWNPILSGNDFENFAKGTAPDDIQKERDDVTWADTLFFVYPIWWLEQPAILKGWIDRVFGQGFGYRYGENGLEGLLTEKNAIVITTWGNVKESVEGQGYAEATKRCTVDGVFGMCGFKRIINKNLYGVPRVTDEDRKNMLTEVRDVVNKATNTDMSKAYAAFAEEF